MTAIVEQSAFVWKELLLIAVVLAIFVSSLRRHLVLALLGAVGFATLFNIPEGLSRALYGSEGVVTSVIGAVEAHNMVAKTHRCKHRHTFVASSRAAHASDMADATDMAGAAGMTSSTGTEGAAGQHVAFSAARARVGKE